MCNIGFVISLFLNSLLKKSATKLFIGFGEYANHAAHKTHLGTQHIVI